MEFLRIKIRYLSVIVTFVAINLNFYSTVNQLSIKYFDTYSVGVLNVWVHSLEGTGIFEPSLGMPFAIPMNWFVLQALLALFNFLVILHKICMDMVANA